MLTIARLQFGNAKFQLPTPPDDRLLNMSLFIPSYKVGGQTKGPVELLGT